LNASWQPSAAERPEADESEAAPLWEKAHRQLI